MIRQDTDYALRMLVHLAGGQGLRAKAREIAHLLGIPESFAQKILRRLAAEGMLVAKAGRQGGFALARPPEQITLLGVIAAVQDRPLLTRCLAGQGTCSQQPTCRVRRKLCDVQNTLDAVLGETTLADILAGG